MLPGLTVLQLRIVSTSRSASVLRHDTVARKTCQCMHIAAGLRSPLCKAKLVSAHSFQSADSHKTCGNSRSCLARQYRDLIPYEQARDGVSGSVCSDPKCSTQHACVRRPGPCRRSSLQPDARTSHYRTQCCCCSTPQCTHWVPEVQLPS